MSTVTTVSRREATPVRIGAWLMYCEHFKAEGGRNYSEKSTVSGDAFFSNINQKALKITFEGRIYDEYLPLRGLLYTNAFMSSNGKCNITYRDAVFADCRVQSFTVDDVGEDYVNVSITLVTTEPPAQSEVS